MKKRLSLKEIFCLGDALFLRGVDKHFSATQLMNLEGATCTSVSPYVDNYGNREMLSQEQMEKLREHGYIAPKEQPEGRRFDNIGMYSREYIRGKASIRREAEVGLICGEPVQEKRVPIFVALVFRDTGDVIEGWNPEGLETFQTSS